MIQCEIASPRIRTPGFAMTMEARKFHQWVSLRGSEATVAIYDF